MAATPRQTRAAPRMGRDHSQGVSVGKDAKKP